MHQIAQYYVDHFIPKEANYLRNILKKIGEESQRPEWISSVILTRCIYSPLTIPIALATAGSYSLQGLKKSVIKISNGEFKEAGKTLSYCGLSALKCLAAAVAQVAFVAIGFFVGARFYAQFIPEFKPLERKREELISPNNCNRPMQPIQSFPSTSNIQEPIKTLEKPVLQQELNPVELPKNTEKTEVLFENESNSLFVKDNEVISTEDLAQEKSIPEPVLDPEVNNTSWSNWIPGCVKGSFGWTMTKVNDWFVDGCDPWKNQRYVVGLKEIEKAIGDEEMRFFENYPKNQLTDKAKEILESVQGAIKSLVSPPENSTPKQQKRSFIDSMRKALVLLQQDPNHEIPQDLETRINSLCTRWTSLPNMTSFYFRMILYIASQGNSSIIEIVKNPKSSLLMMFKGLLEGIQQADPKFKAPYAHLNLQKAKVLGKDYDNMIGQNHTSQIAKITYYHPKEGLRVVQEYRSGVPITKRLTQGNEKPWECEEVSLTPEFVGFLNDIKNRKEKLLLVLHLNPKWYNTSTKALKTTFWEDPNLKEARWIKLFIQMSESPQYRETISVALVPMDGEWGHVIETTEMTLNQLKLFLVNLIIQTDSPYILPGMEEEEKKAFAEEILKTTQNAYFNSFQEHEDLLNLEQRQAFLGIFNSFLVEALQVKENPQYVQRNCKDGVDRTGAWVGIELLERAYRLKTLTHKNIKKILGITCGPALGILKRELLDSRQPILLATASYLDSLKAKGINEIELPSYQGWELKEMELGSVKEQNLYPAPSEAKNEEEYKRFLKHEIQYPFSAQHRFKVGSFEKVSKILKNRYNHEILGYQIEEKEVDVECLQRDYVIMDSSKKTVASLTVKYESQKKQFSYTIK